MLCIIIKCLEEGIYTGGYAKDGEIMAREFNHLTHEEFIKSDWNSKFKYNLLFDYKNKKVELDVRRIMGDELIYSCELNKPHAWDLIELWDESGFIYTDGLNISRINYCK